MSSNKEKAKSIALFLMEEYGLIDKGWKFKFNNRKRAFGLCSHDKKTIFLSSHWAEHRDIELTIKTIKHEIAHALVGAGHGHNHVWKAKMRELGEEPNRCGTRGDAPPPEAKWHVVIEDTGEIVDRYYRKPRRDFSKSWIVGRKAETFGKLMLVPAS